MNEFIIEKARIVTLNKIMQKWKPEANKIRYAQIQMIRYRQSLLGMIFLPIFLGIYFELSTAITIFLTLTFPILLYFILSRHIYKTTPCPICGKQFFKFSEGGTTMTDCQNCKWSALEKE